MQNAECLGCRRKEDDAKYEKVVSAATKKKNWSFRGSLQKLVWLLLHITRIWTEQQQWEEDGDRGVQSDY